MRIALIVDWFLYYTVELANALSKEHEVMLVTRDHAYEIDPGSKQADNNEFLNEYLDPKIRRETLKYRQRDLRNVFEVIRVFKRIKAFRPQVIHVQETSDWRIAFITCLFSSQRLVLTIHDVVRHPDEKKKRVHPICLFLRMRAQKIIVHGKYLKGLLSSLSPRLANRICVILHGTFTIYKRWDNGEISEEPRTVLFFGYICKYKGIDVLIETEPLISREIPDVKILIVGQGKEFEKYRDSLRANLHFEVHNEFVPTEEVYKYFRRAAVVVLPYIEVSQSGVVPLAYAFGKPVVVTDVGSIAEVVEDGKTGFIVTPKKPDELAKAVIRILKSDDLRTLMSINAKKKASTDLAWENIAQETVQVYVSVAGHEP